MLLPTILVLAATTQEPPLLEDCYSQLPPETVCSDTYYRIEDWANQTKCLYDQKSTPATLQEWEQAKWMKQVWWAAWWVRWSDAQPWERDQWAAKLLELVGPTMFETGRLPDPFRLE
jgi:hypothetical protein